MFNYIISLFHDRSAIVLEENDIVRNNTGSQSGLSLAISDLSVGYLSCDQCSLAFAQVINNGITQ